MPQLTFAATGESYDVPEGTRFLDFCQENNLPHDFGCTVGSCGTCACVVTEGADSLPPIGDEESETVEMATDEEGARLGCQLVISGDITVRAAEV
ncbi:MAG: 2Fe-2S iron-sulfur cluster-binding protein [Planctomycetota bacterium]|nr:2Fe-2S iron-sulfur cluster-binding protein [Planctomycetota bacterium]